MSLGSDRGAAVSRVGQLGREFELQQGGSLGHGKELVAVVGLARGGVLGGLVLVQGHLGRTGTLSNVAAVGKVEAQRLSTGEIHLSQHERRLLGALLKEFHDLAHACERALETDVLLEFNFFLPLLEVCVVHRLLGFCELVTP